MYSLERTHWTLVQKRTHIRHDKRTLLWIQRCWNAARLISNRPGSSSCYSMTRGDYDSVYRKLIIAMTIDWDDRDFRSVVDLMWCRDTKAFESLDVGRFSCSIFSFTEMWVETLEVAEYARVLQLIHCILLSTTSDKLIVRRSNPTSLTAFLNAVRHETQLAAMNLSIGKSLVFDLEQYVRLFGRAVPDAVSTVVASIRGHKPAPRRNSSKLLPSAVHHTQHLVGPKHLAPYRPRSCSAVVRMDSSIQSPTPNKQH